MELIDKSAIVAEIEKRRDLHYKYYVKNGAGSIAECKYEEDRDILDFLDTIESKDVDLKKEIANQYESNYEEYLRYEEFAETAKHFFELGLKARIDKELVEEVYSHIDSIKDTADRMTSGNFMHNRAAIKFSANTIAKVLELIGLKVAQKGEEYE